MNLKKWTSAFTLVELLVAMGVATMIGSVIIAAFITGQRSFISGTNFLEIHGDVRVAMDWMVRDIKWASQTLTSVTISTSTYFTGANELVLSVPSIDGSNDIITATFDTVVYTVTGTDLVRIVEPDVTSSRPADNKIIANNVNNIQFAVAADNIGIVLNVRKTVLGGRVLDETLATNVSLRNT